MMIDDEEEFEKMCDSCKDKSHIERCPVCAKAINEENINPNFDESKFKALKQKNGGVVNEK